MSKSEQASIRKGLQAAVYKNVSTDFLKGMSKPLKLMHKIFMERPIWNTLYIEETSEDGTWLWSPSLGIRLQGADIPAARLLLAGVGAWRLWPDWPKAGGFTSLLARPSKKSGAPIRIDAAPHSDQCSYRAVHYLGKDPFGEVLFPVATLLKDYLKKGYTFTEKDYMGTAWDTDGKRTAFFPIMEGCYAHDKTTASVETTA